MNKNPTPTLGLWYEGRVYGDVVGQGPQLLQLHPLNTELRAHASGDDRVIPNCLGMNNMMLSLKHIKMIQYF